MVLSYFQSLVVLGLRSVFSQIYDWGFVIPLTNEVYRQEGARLVRSFDLDLSKSKGITILDVGCATATPALQLLATPGLKVQHYYGLDIDEGYLETAKTNLQHIPQATTILADFTTLREEVPNLPKFSVVLFGFSLMFMPSITDTLKNAAGMLTENGQIVIYLTLYKEQSFFLDTVKPAIVYLTSIDFGKPIYDQELQSAITASGLHIVEQTKLEGTLAMQLFNVHRIVLSKGSKGANQPT